ncbi:hypothetical protein ACT4ML_07315 [Natrinema sp. LN54]|uniref:hypothetical protein n=1 Tax=Natrinema sp. LN54 TaxID=3458705 RepID=UPI004036DA6F
MVDDALVGAVESIPDADPDSIAQYDDDCGHFVIHSDADDQDVDEIDEALKEVGYERDGHIPAPGMVQQNFRPLEDGEGDDE